MAKYTSKGTLLQKSIASVYTTIVNVDSISGPDSEVEDMVVTDLSSGAGHEHGVTGYVEPGQVSGSCFFDPAAATHTSMTSRLASPGFDNYKIIWSDAAPTSWTYSACLKKFTPKAQMGDFLKADFAMQLTGLVTGW